MRIRIGFAMTLALVVLTLGSTGTSAAPATTTSENAVVYWSGIAEVAIAAGRPPASSSVLGGDGARRDVRRRRRHRGRARAVRNRV